MEINAQNWVFGRTVVLQLLNKHPHLLEKLFVKTKHSLLPLLKEKGFAYQTWLPSQFQQQFPHQNHQFICAIVKKYPYFQWKQFLSHLTNNSQQQLILILDHIQDVYNFGAILRTASATKVDAVIVPNFNQAPINALTIKAATGNIFNLKIIQVANLNTIIAQLKKHNFWIYAASTLEGAQLHYQTDFQNLNVALIVGNEHRGVSSLLVKKADFKIKIPMFDTESLNVSNATAVLLYQIRQNQKFWSKLK